MVTWETQSKVHEKQCRNTLSLISIDFLSLQLTTFSEFYRDEFCQNYIKKTKTRPQGPCRQIERITTKKSNRYVTKYEYWDCIRPKYNTCGLSWVLTSQQNPIHARYRKFSSRNYSYGTHESHLNSKSKAALDVERERERPLVPKALDP